jgi:hypothetical protein
MPQQPAVELYNREAALRHRLNAFLCERFGLPESDYYAGLTADAFLALKSVLADINNILTLKVSWAFVEWVTLQLGLGLEATSELKQALLAAKPNANGYDIGLNGPIPFVAEVKCNVPINQGDIYGSAQRTGIEKDVTALLHGKRKASVDSKECLKFLAFLDRPEIRTANEHLCRLSVVENCKSSWTRHGGKSTYQRSEDCVGVARRPR